MRFKLNWNIVGLFFVLAFAIMLVFGGCASHNYKSPLGLWTRPHPQDKGMAYDTLAYRALHKGNPEALKQLQERDGVIIAEREERQRQKQAEREYWAPYQRNIFADYLLDCFFYQSSNFWDEWEREEQKQRLQTIKRQNKRLEDQLWEIQRKLEEMEQERLFEWLDN